VSRTTIVHFDDALPGVGQYGSGARRDEFAQAFQTSIDVAVERGADAVVHTGYLFDGPLPALPTVTRCAAALDLLAEHDVEFYGIAGEQSPDDRWADLLRGPNAPPQLGREPTLVGNTAVYGIDAVRAGDWQQPDVALEEPPAGVDRAILCVPSVPELDGGERNADSIVEDLLDRVGVAVDGLVLGGSIRPGSTRVDGTDVWYAGTTERGVDDTAAGAAQRLEIDDDGDVTRQRLELETRPFPARVADGADGAVDGPGKFRGATETLAEEVLQTAQDAVETAALWSFGRRVRREAASGPPDASESTPEAEPIRTDDGEEIVELDGGTTPEREELVGERQRLDDELSELGATVDDAVAERDALEADVATAVSNRDVATDAFLPDDRLPDSVSGETRDAVASYVDTIGERRDVQSEGLAMKRESLDVEVTNAADARDDIDEVTAVIDRLEDRMEVLESVAADAREELDAARSQFSDDLAALATQLAPLDVDLTEETLGTVVDERIPERTAEIEASIAEARERIEDLSARRSTLAAEREELQSIDGGGTCPTCNQTVGSARTESEIAAIGEDVDEVERELGAAKQDRDDLIARREQLSDGRAEATALRSFRSETVAEAAGRLEDRQENVEDLQADLDEARSELTELRAERDRADAAIATLETEIHSTEAEIDRLEAKAEEGERSLEGFRVVDRLRAQLEERTDALADLQETYEELELERAAVDAEIERLPE